MRVVAQVVKNAAVKIEEAVHNEIEYGLLLLVSFCEGDNLTVVEKMAKTIALMRVFPDENDKTNLSLADVSGEVLSISQFTLYGEFKGRRPSFTKSLKGSESVVLYDAINEELSKLVTVKTGVFGANMELTFTNVGPATYLLEEYGK